MPSNRPQNHNTTTQVSLDIRENKFYCLANGTGFTYCHSAHPEEISLTRKKAGFFIENLQRKEVKKKMKKLIIGLLSLVFMLVMVKTALAYSFTDAQDVNNGTVGQLVVDVAEDGDWMVWTFDFPVELFTGDGNLSVGLIIATDGEGSGPSFQIHSNDGSDANYPWGTWLMSPWGPAIDTPGSWQGWWSGSVNTPVSTLDWVEAIGQRNTPWEGIVSGDGVMVIKIKKSELGESFHWAANPTVGTGFWPPAYDVTMQIPTGFDWGTPLVNMGVPNYVYAYVPAPFVRSATITSPLTGEEVSGMVSFDATLTDKDGNDNVQWAVRKGTCAANTNTVLGNVDGFSSPFTWDHYNFHASTDTSAWIPGGYCFIFNPTESAGDTAIRETSEFVLKDTVAPLVTIESPSEGNEVSGTVEIYGTVVEDYLLSHYNISVYRGTDDFNDFSKRISQTTVYRSTGFNNELIFGWDSTAWDDGEYLIRLAARDAAGNRSYAGDPYLGGDDSQHVIRVTVNNVPDLIGPPVDKNECKKDGWKTFNNPFFKNQGDCVSYVQSNENAVGNRKDN